MTKLIAIHRAYTALGTFGELYSGGELICYTVERPWQDNKSNISCIPEGIYKVEPYTSPTHGECYIVHNEGNGVSKFKDDTNRWGILFHKANYPEQLGGCIAPVSRLGILNARWGGLSSEQAFKRLNELLGGSEAILEIRTKTIC